MGQVLSFFWKKKSLLDELTELEDSITSITEYNANVERKHKQAITFLFTSGILLVIIAGLYLYFVPCRSLRETIMYSACLTLVSICLYFLRQVVSWYYQMKLKKNRLKLIKTKEEKTNIIKKVMETETYNVAREILQKYSKDLIQSPVPSSTPSQLIANRNEIRRRTVAVSSTPSGGPYSAWPVSTREAPANLLPDSAGQGKSFMNTFAERLAGDSLYKRYALICKFCSCHNGLALPEEFPYMNFRCMTCRKLNPARKSRPSPPQLDTQDNTISETEYTSFVDNNEKVDDGEQVESEEENGGGHVKKLSNGSGIGSREDEHNIED